MGFELAEELRSRVGEIKEKFDHLICRDVCIDDIGILWYNNPKSAYKGKIVKVAEIYKVMSMPLFILVIWKQGWEKAKEGARNALILHELLHIGYSAQTGKYYVRKHDVEDFKVIINKIGMNWEKAEELLKEKKK